jgi:GGDEF domain-containing protein
MGKRQTVNDRHGDQRRILNRDVFFRLLDLEVKRARRYQNFFSLLIMRLKGLTDRMESGALQDSYQKLCGLLSSELRANDILGALDRDKVVALLPYADMMAADSVKSRFEGNFKYFSFYDEGFEVEMKRFCFPMDGADTGDLIQRLIGAQS